MAKEKTLNDEIWFGRYGQDAQEAWNSYEKTGKANQLAEVLRDRMKEADHRMVQMAFLYGLVFTTK